jgi:hypothetical protein
MSRLDELPPDQRAALSLLLSRGKSYAEVASLLQMPERAVQDRAHAALAVLAPAQARGLTPESRREIGDYLLSQQPGVAERLRTRTQISASEPSRMWASALAAELAPIAPPSGLPEIPADGSRAPAPARSHATSQAAPAAAATSGASGPAVTSSRLGGALLLGALVIIVVAAVLILSGNNSSNTKSPKTSTTAKAPNIVARVPMRSPSRVSRSIGLVEVLEEAGKKAFYIAAENLPPSKGFFYAIWLYNGPGHAKPVSKAPPVSSNKRLAGGALLPANAAEYHAMLVTRETKALPTYPGPVVLRGPLNLSG